MATLGEYLGAGASTTKLLLHLNGNSTDSSGNGNNGTDTSITYSLANGKFGQGAGFNGSSSVINVGYTAPTTDWTYSFWVNPTNFSAERALIHNFLNTTSGRNIYIHFNATTGAIDVDIPYIKDSVVTGTAPSTGVFSHIAVTRSGSAWKIYLNGNQVGSATDSTSQESTTVCRIGKTNASQAHLGSIDEVIVESRAWTASEIKKYYTYSKGRFGIL